MTEDDQDEKDANEDKTEDDEDEKNDNEEKTGDDEDETEADEELDGLLLLVVWVEDSLVEVLEREVENLGWEIADDIGEVTSPESSESLFSVHTNEAVADSIVSLVGWDVLNVVLHLEEKLDSLNWGDHSLGDSSGDTSEKEIGREILLVFATWSFFEHL